VCGDSDVRHSDSRDLEEPARTLVRSPLSLPQLWRIVSGSSARGTYQYAAFLLCVGVLVYGLGALLNGTVTGRLRLCWAATVRIKTAQGAPDLASSALPRVEA